jgi:sugar lactone lactonase YvrE
VRAVTTKLLLLTVFVAATSARGALLYVNTTKVEIVTVSPAGVVAPFASGGELGGLAVDSAGNLYSGDSSQIYKITPSGTETTFVTGLNQVPGGLAFDANGNLFSANQGSGTIIEITPSGTVSLFASGLSNPRGLAFDSNGNLFAANFTSNTISKIDPSGTVSLFASGFNEPAGLAFDGGDLFVANFGGNTISRVSPSGAVSLYASSVGQDPNYIAFAVPEPSALGLLLAGLVSISLIARMR